MSIIINVISLNFIERVDIMDYNKIEDAVLKKAMDVFRQSAVEFFGIDTEILYPAETEIKNIDIKTNFTDYLFYGSDGSYVHFEFQTTTKKEDLKRFLYYDASLFYKDKRKINTIVIYSSDITDVETYIDAGTIKYEVKAFYMKSLNGDDKLRELSEKIQSGIDLTEKDILSLSLLPLMNSNEDKSSRTIKSIELANHIKNNENKIKCMSLLYALLEKFGDDFSKKKFKEVISMTEIGKMIYEEGKEEGREQGKLEGKKEGLKEGIFEGKVETLIKQLLKKFKKVPQEYLDKIKKLPIETIDLITIEIFDLEEIKDIEKYL